MKTKNTFRRHLLLTIAAAAGLIAFTTSDALAQGQANVRLDQDLQQIQLSDVISHTIYEERLVRRTCYRDVIVRYERVCRQRPPLCHEEQQCRDVPYEVCEGKGRDRKCETKVRRVCRTIQKCVNQEPVCTTRPIYRREAYDCSYYQTVPVGTEIDYQVQAKIEVRVNNTTGISASGEILKLVLDQSQLTATSAESSGALVLLARKHIRSTTVREDQGPHRPGLIQVDAIIDIVAMSRTDALAILAGGVRDLELTQSLVTATLGENMISELVVPSLKITRHKSLVPDTRLVNRELTPSEYEMVDLGSKTEIRIDLDKLLMKESVEAGKTYQAELEISLQSRNGLEILNEQVLGNLKAKGKVRVKIK